MQSESTDPLHRTRRQFGTIVRVLRIPRLLGTPNEPLLPSIVSSAFECLQEFRVSFLSVFLFLLSFSLGLLLLLFSLGLALSALRILVELVFINLLLLWFSVSDRSECMRE